MSEENKKQIKKRIAAVEIGIAAILLIYLVYGIATKNSNQMIFNILATILVVASVVLNDVVEPYLTKVLENMDEFRKEAYKKYVFWDIASWAGLLLFVFTFGSDESTFMIVSVLLYVVASRQKRDYKAAAFGQITKEEVELAKAAVMEGEAAEVEDNAAAVEEKTETEE